MRSDEEMKWKTLSSEYIIKRPWLTARRDKVQLPNGNINDEYWVLEYPEWINIIAITKEGKIILERQWRQAVGEVSTEIPAGVVEKGEEPLHAAQRELQEETGFGGGKWTQLMRIAPNSSSNNNFTHCFLAEGVERIGDTQFDDTEDLEVYFESREKVFEMLEQGIFHQAQMVAPLWKYFATSGEDYGLRIRD